MQKLHRVGSVVPGTIFARAPEFRARVMAHKKNRQIAVGPNTMWLFEDRLTVQYQVQEMLRTERIFEAEGHRRGARRLQPADPRRTQLEGDLADRVSGS